MTQATMERKNNEKRYTAEILNGAALCNLLAWSPDEEPVLPFDLELLVLHNQQLYKISAGSVKSVLPVKPRGEPGPLQDFIQIASDRALKLEGTEAGKQWRLIAGWLKELKLRREGKHSEVTTAGHKRMGVCTKCGKNIPPGVGILTNSTVRPTCGQCQAEVTFLSKVV